MATNRNPLTRVAVTSLAAIVTATAALAVEVRQSEEPANYHPQLDRAYAPCPAPNDVTRNCIPACNPRARPFRTVSST